MGDGRKGGYTTDMKLSALWCQGPVHRWWYGVVLWCSYIILSVIYSLCFLFLACTYVACLLLSHLVSGAGRDVHTRAVQYDDHPYI